VMLAGSPAAGDGSYLRLTSRHDGAQQTLDSEELQTWFYSSAYFNGSKVLVELLAYPGTGPNRVEVASASVASQEADPRTTCGESDRRVPSTDPRVARLVPGACSAFLVDEGDCANRFLTAGHCVSEPSSWRIAQFNVPPSRPNGQLVHPLPKDQYPVDLSSIQAVDEGEGRDYGTFLVGVNSETGLTPRAVQGAAFHLADSVSRQPEDYWAGVQVTGYGVDLGSMNQTHQKDSGLMLGKFDTTLRYRVDTQLGNSGSPVINEIDDRVLGIHTHGGCTSSSTSFNRGNAIDDPGLVQMLENGPVGTCEEHQFCVPDALWYFDGATSWDDREPIDAWHDGRNCYVHALAPTDGEPFIHENRSYLVTP
ncbi:MAG: trypsin-like peptidase domain-containing protein, partial [Acidobacteriota bacterium]